MSAINRKGIIDAECEADEVLAAALARYARHICEQEYSLDMLELYKNLDIYDPLLQHLDNIRTRSIPTLPLVQPFADIAIAYEALCRFSGERL